MSEFSELKPETARLVARLSFFLDEAEAALGDAQPERVVQAAGAWAQICRELRQLPLAQWPSAEARSACIGQMATRVAALQQAVVRAQARIGRGVELLMGGSVGIGAPTASPLVLPTGGYDAAGYRSNTPRAGGAYA